jgi:hypothetical protein
MSDAPRTRAECTLSFMVPRQPREAPSLDQRVEARTLDIANRLRFVCSHLPDDELLDLATRMAIVEVKYAGGKELHLPRRRAANG